MSSFDGGGESYNFPDADLKRLSEKLLDMIAANYRVPAPKAQELTASGAVSAGVGSVELSHASVVVAATIADSTNHTGLFIVKNTSASGTEAHTLTLTSGTWDGSNTIATLNAPNEALVVYFDSAGNGTIIENVGSVALS